MFPFTSFEIFMSCVIDALFIFDNCSSKMKCFEKFFHVLDNSYTGYTDRSCKESLAVILGNVGRLMVS